MSEHHIGLRRRQSRLPIARLLVLAIALAAIIRLLTLSDPGREPAPAGTPFVAAVPTWSGPAPVDVAGVLADGATYTPRLYLTADTSVGVATGADGTVRVLLDQARGQATELRRLSPADHPQVNGFAFSDDTLVWMESVSRPGSGVVTTTLWRTTWRTAARPVLLTTNTGEPMFYGVQSDVLVRDGRVYWTAVGAGNSAGTELRSVAVTGGPVTTKRIPGEYMLSAWPWMVSVTGGRGAAVTMLDVTTNATVTVATGSTDIPVCTPTWCRMAVAGGDGLAGIDVMRPDGSQRRRIANSEATPTIADATLLDRYVPLATDRSSGGVGLSLYDINTGHTDLLAVGVANIQGRDGILWWSTGAGPELVWHAVDLHVLG